MTTFSGFAEAAALALSAATAPGLAATSVRAAPVLELLAPAPPAPAQSARANQSSARANQLPAPAPSARATSSVKPAGTRSFRTSLPTNRSLSSQLFFLSSFFFTRFLCLGAHFAGTYLEIYLPSYPSIPCLRCPSPLRSASRDIFWCPSRSYGLADTWRQIR